MSIMKTVIRRNILTKRRRLAAVTACIALIALVSGTAEGLPPTECGSVECIRTAANVMSKMNSEIDPCDNFYKFACGSFLENTQIPEDTYVVDEFSGIMTQVQKQLYDILREERPKEDPKHLKLPHTFYAACMDEIVIEAMGPKPIEKIANKLGGWPVLDCDCWDYDDTWKWEETVWKLGHLGFNLNIILSLSIGVDEKNSRRYILELDQSSTGLSHAYLINGFEDPLVLAYYDYMVDIAVLLGADKKTAKTELRKSLQFEINLAKISKPFAQRGDSDDFYNLRSIKELQKSYPYIQWLDFINNFLPNGVNVTEGEIINVAVLSYFEDLGKLIAKTKRRDIANYVMWRAYDYSVDYLPEKFRKRKFQYTSVSSGQEQESARWEQCVDRVAASFGSPLGSLYVRKHFKEESKASAMEMVNNIREAFRLIIGNAKWMDTSTKQQAQEKLKLITTHIGYSEELLDNTILKQYYRKMRRIDPNKFLQSALNINIFNDEVSFNHLRMPVKKNDWSRLASPAVVNAYYSESDNYINFPAAILQGHVFGKERPKFMNYGSIGYVIGHEITHGFDQRGSQFDGHGDLTDWWNPATKRDFKEKSQCFVEQYGNYTDQQTGANLNGLNTLNENIADNGGVKATYSAYKQFLVKNGEEPHLPGLNYTSLQMFWLALAQTWCSAFKTEALLDAITTGVHSPHYIRSLGPLRNMEAFSTDFNCALNTGMNPAKKCEVW